MSVLRKVQLNIDLKCVMGIAINHPPNFKHHILFITNLHMLVLSFLFKREEHNLFQKKGKKVFHLYGLIKLITRLFKFIYNNVGAQDSCRTGG